jgi:uncharacterized protein (TIGR03435 family)
MRWIGFCLVAAATVPAFAQPPEFEVASVKQVSGRTGAAALAKFDENDTRVSYTNFRLKILISIAYRTSDSRITGGPGWLDSEPYDLTANLPANARKEQIPEMLQKLLADRFQLTVRRESRQMPAFFLVAAADGPKLKSPKSDTSGGNYILRGRIGGPAMPIPVLADALGRVIGSPVIDKTGLSEKFDILLKWTPDPDAASAAPVSGDSPPTAAPAGPSIYTALQEQLGLKLQSTKAPVEFLVVTHAEKIPAAN